MEDIYVESGVPGERLNGRDEMIENHDDDEIASEDEDEGEGKEKEDETGDGDQGGDDDTIGGEGENGKWWVS